MNKIKIVLLALALMVSVFIVTPAPSADALGPGQVCVASGAGRGVTVRYGSQGGYASVIIYPGQCSTLSKNAIAWRPPVNYVAKWRFAEEGLVTRSCVGVSTTQYCSTLGQSIKVLAVVPAG